MFYPNVNSMGLALMQAPSFDEAVERVQREENFTAIIAENDLYRSIPPAIADSFFSKCKNVIVLDSLNNRTTEKADVLITCCNFCRRRWNLLIMKDGLSVFTRCSCLRTLLLKESWRWLWNMQLLKMQNSNGSGSSS